MVNEELKVRFPSKTSDADNCICNACHHIGRVVKLELPETLYNRNGVLKTMDNTRKKLINLLSKCLPKNITILSYDDNFTVNIKQGNIADHLIANGVTLDNQVSSSKWISVKDRLPENDYGKHWKERKHYLVSLAPSGLMCVAHYGYKEYGWWIDGHDCVLSATNFKEVTHWMEINNLPQPPKGE